MRMVKEKWSSVVESIGCGPHSGAHGGAVRPPARRAELLTGMLRHSLSADPEAFNEAIGPEEGE